MAKKVDILLATYNGERYLKEQLDSILNQTYKDFNLIISDDCSTNKETIQILKEYEKKDERIKVFYQEKNLGSNSNFEFLLSKVESKYYMFSDQDDIWINDKVKLCIEAIEREKVDLVYTDLQVVDKDLNVIDNSFNKKMGLLSKQKKYTDFRLEYLYNCITGCTILARTSLLKDILQLTNNKDILHDYWIGLVTSMKGRIYYLNIPTIKYRQHIDNQVGTIKYTYRIKTFDEKRDYIIDLKIEKFKTYILRKECFDNNLQNLNEKALEYFTRVKQKRNVNFKGWKVYRNIFKYESIGYYIFYFLFYNFPFIYRIGYNTYCIFKK